MAKKDDIGVVLIKKTDKRVWDNLLKDWNPPHSMIYGSFAKEIVNKTRLQHPNPWTPIRQSTGQHFEDYVSERDIKISRGVDEYQPLKGSAYPLETEAVAEVFAKYPDVKFVLVRSHDDSVFYAHRKYEQRSYERGGVVTSPVSRLCPITWS